MLAAARAENSAVVDWARRTALISCRFVVLLALVAGLLSLASDDSRAQTDSSASQTPDSSQPPVRSAAEITGDIEGGQLTGEALAAAYLERGDVWARKEGQPEKAIADYDRAIELNPNLGKAYSHRGIVRKQGGKLDEAIADF